MAISVLLPAIPQMMYLVHKKIFEGVNYHEEKALEDGLKGWVKVDNLDNKDKQDLSYVLQALIANEKGEWDKVKNTFKEHGIPWRTVYSDMWRC